MALTDFDTLVGELEIATRPATLCFGKPWDFVENLVKFLRVKFPVNRNNNFIVAGSETPSVDDTDKLWAKFSRNRSPLGWYAFISGKWRRFYTVVPGEIRWVAGDSENPPEGWAVVTQTSTGVTAAVWDEISKHYVDGANAGQYYYFAIRYVGY